MNGRVGDEERGEDDDLGDENDDEGERKYEERRETAIYEGKRVLTLNFFLADGSR